MLKCKEFFSAYDAVDLRLSFAGFGGMEEGCNWKGGVYNQ